MSKKHDPVIQAAIIQAAATLVANKEAIAAQKEGARFDTDGQFGAALTLVSLNFNEFLAKRGQE